MYACVRGAESSTKYDAVVSSDSMDIYHHNHDHYHNNHHNTFNHHSHELSSSINIHTLASFAIGDPSKHKQQHDDILP